MQNEIRFDILHQVWEMLLDIHRDRKARKHFDLSKYVAVGWPNQCEEIDSMASVAAAAQVAKNCGTVGCAWGWAAICVPDVHYVFKVADDFRRSDIADFLGITTEQVNWCFMPDQYEITPTPREVADRIAALIESLPGAQA